MKAKLLERRASVGYSATGEIGNLERSRPLTHCNPYYRRQRNLFASGRVATDHCAARLIARLLCDRSELESRILDCQARLLLAKTCNVGNDCRPLASADCQRHVDAALLCAAGRRILLENNSLSNCLVKARLTLNAVKPGLVECGDSILEPSSDNSRNLPVIGKNFRRECKEKEKDVGEQETES